ncbi:MAG: hypothetical protein A2W25_02460 [candidate division Zixibacteria bacterium RBG_16_53_22]|nr:MAG: hypothetical protein A2W25_02460 [candidate division Zixibacteria bacterium RBG_16_53_22]
MKIIWAALLLAIIIPALVAAQLPGDFNCSGAVNGLDVTYLMTYFQDQLVILGSCTWQNGDLNYDSLFHSVADWRQLLMRASGDSLIYDPPSSSDLDTMSMPIVVGAPGDEISLPIMIAIADSICDFMAQIDIDTTFLQNWQLQSIYPFRMLCIYSQGSFYWWQMYDPDWLDPGSHQIGTVDVTISPNCPNTFIPINFVGGDYYPSGFSNYSYPTFFIGPVLINGGIQVVQSGTDEDAPKYEYGLRLANYPNPFNGQTLISFTLENEAATQVGIFDISGRKVGDLLDGIMPAGDHEIIWHASGATSGIYFCVANVSGRIFSKTITLIK